MVVRPSYIFIMESVMFIHHDKIKQENNYRVFRINVRIFCFTINGEYIISMQMGVYDAIITCFKEQLDFAILILFVIENTS